MVEAPLVAALAVNLAALLGLVLVAEPLVRQSKIPGRLADLAVGVALALFGVGATLVPIEFASGLTVDVSQVVLGLGALYLGAVAVVVPLLAIATVALAQLGPDSWPGVAGLAISAGVGLAWRSRRVGRLDRLLARELYAFALVVITAWGLVALPTKLPTIDGPWWGSAIILVGVLPILAMLVGLALAHALESQKHARQERITLREALEAQRQLAGMASKLELMLEHAPVELAMFDRERRFIAISKRLRDQARIGDVELVGHHHDEVFSDVPDSFIEAQYRALQGEVVRADEVHFVRADGRELWLRWEKRPWYEEDGSIGGFVLFTENVTESIQARQQLVKLSTAVEQSPDSVIITNLDAEIEYVNQAFTDLSGYAKDDVIGRNPRLLQSGKTPIATYHAMWASLTSGKAWRGEFINRRQDGTEYVEFASVAPVRVDNGEVTHYLKVGEDVTEKKRLGDELDHYRDRLEVLVEERTRELEEARLRADAANQAKSAFLANMSHEIRTPLNAVVGLTHLLLRDDPTPDQRQRLEKVDGSAGHLLSIINDVLDIAKIEEGKLALLDRDFHLSAVLDHVHSIVAASAEAKGLSIETDRDHVPVWLRGDAARLRQALLNLAGNAVKYTQQGFVRMRTELLSDTDEGLLVRFEVEDSGIGIDMNEPTLLFEDFEQLATPLEIEHSGTGLGLAITRRLAELMGGETGIESKPGLGTTAWFTAVLQRGHGVTPPDSRARSEPVTEDWRRMAGKRVLLAEDQALNREVAMELLHGYELQVDVAEDGRFAVERAAERRYDLILMDLQMPRLDGLSATREIRMLPDYRDVPILAMSANAFEEDRRACLEAGMNDFIAKPVDPDTLRDTLARWLVEPAVSADPKPESHVGEPDTTVETDATVAPDGPDGETVPLGYDGLDFATGVNAVGGNKERYLALLRRFAQAHADDANNLREELLAGDHEAALHRAHGLKGVAGTLGVTDLHDSAALLESALRTSKTAEPELVDTVASDIGRLLTHLAQLPDPEPAAPDPSSLSANRVLARLAELLDGDDVQALDWIGQHIGVLRGAFGQEADSLHARVDGFEFAAARKLVGELRSRAKDEI